jgi:hypothetical protein
MKCIQPIRRSVTVLAGLLGTLLALAAAAPAALATLPPPEPALPVHTVITGGMPGWQITVIATGAALFAAFVAVFLDRARTARRSVTASAA